MNNGRGGEIADEQEDVNVLILEEDDNSRVKRLYLPPHCIFCLRETVPQENGRRRKTRGRVLDEQVPEADLSGLALSSAFLSTLNWMWQWALRRKEVEPGMIDFGGGGEESQEIARFKSLPKICQDCEYKVIGLHNLLYKVSELVLKLKDVVRDSGKGESWRRFEEHFEESRLVREEMEETVKFYGMLRSPDWTEQVQKARDQVPDARPSPSPDADPPSFSGSDDTQENQAVNSLPLVVKVEVDEEIPNSNLNPAVNLKFEPDHNPTLSNTKQDDFLNKLKARRRMVSSAPVLQLLPEPRHRPKDDCVKKGRIIQMPEVQSGCSVKVEAPEEPLNTEDDDSDRDPESYNSEEEDDNAVGDSRSNSPSSKKSNESSESDEADYPESELNKPAKGRKRSLVRDPLCLEDNDNPPPDKKKQKYRCNEEECGILVSGYAAFQRHQLQEHGINTNPTKVTRACEVCKESLSFSNILEHYQRHMGKDYNLISCTNPDCWFICVTTKWLELHLRASSRCQKNSPGDFLQVPKDLLTCSECGFFGSDLHSLRSHIRIRHENVHDGKSFPCPISGCQKCFGGKLSLLLHLQEHKLQTKPNPITSCIPEDFKGQSCPTCWSNGGTRRKIEDMDAHLQEVHGISPSEIIKCSQSQCPFLFASREHLVDHLYVHRKNVMNCDLCGESFGNHARLVEHYLTEHQVGKKFECEHCSRMFWKQCSLNNHLYTGHRDKIKNLETGAKNKCDECGTEFKTKETLRSHQIREHNAEKYCCSSCSKTFITKRGVREHEQVVHKGIPLKRFSCQEPNCGKTFWKRSLLKDHYSRVHLGESPKKAFVCDLCGKSCSQAGTLKKHKETVHLGIKKYVCDICGNAFAKSGGLKSHKLRHTKERPFGCEICGQLFRRREPLIAHLKRHEAQGADFKPKASFDRQKIVLQKSSID